MKKKAETRTAKTAAAKRAVSKKTSKKKSSPKLRAKQPKSLLKKPLKLDLRGAFKAVGKAIAHAAIGDDSKIPTDTVDALAAIGLKTAPGELAGLLIKRAVLRAVLDLVLDSGAEQFVDLDQRDTDLDVSVEITDADFDRKFLDRPADAAFIAPVQDRLGAWLGTQAINQATVLAIVDRFPSYFVYALVHEWRQNADKYKPLAEAWDTPFSRAGEREWAWAEYAAHLEQQTHAAVFDEPFGLRQIYIPLNAWYYRDKKQGDAVVRGTRDKRQRVVVPLHDELRNWLAKSDSRDALRVLSGGPGSGKSSFARIFAADVAAEGEYRVVFVPLHLLDPDKDFEDELGRFVQAEGVLLQNPLDRDDPEPKLLIILDGLDELAGQGKAAAETARRFVEEVRRTLDRRNHNPKVCLRVLISGREVVVQENETEFRRPGQILSLLPYFVPDDNEQADNRKAYTDPDDILSVDLRDQWWRKYGELTGQPYAGLPEELARPDLAEITAQPLLNYLIAMSYTRGELDFSREINLNSIYRDLVEAVYERGYEKAGPHAATRNLSRDEFFMVLEEIGLATWHGDTRSATEAEIERYCRNSGLDRMLAAFKQGAKAGVTRLLAAFFFRRHSKRITGEPTFVFTHKSFGEYLTARRIVRGMERIIEERAARTKRPDRGWDEFSALKHWLKITGPAAMTSDLHPFLLNEVRLREAEELAAWQTEFANLFSHILAHRSPAERLRLETFQQAALHARNAEEALLMALNACARVTKRCSRITHPDTASFGAWLRVIQGQFDWAGPSSLSWLNLSGSELSLGNLFRCNLANSELRGVLALLANLYEANLEDANLTVANLEGANLERASLEGANLIVANLKHANLTNANLERANLFDANLEHANLFGANLFGANLERASLEDANLKDANLERANLERAKLTVANLEDANLRNANLAQTIRTGASFEGADLRGTILEETAGARNATSKRTAAKE